METEYRGIIYKPDNTKGIQSFFDAYFAGGWNQLDVENSENMMSRTGYLRTYTGCPLL